MRKASLSQLRAPALQVRKARSRLLSRELTRVPPEQHLLVPIRLIIAARLGGLNPSYSSTHNPPLSQRWLGRISMPLHWRPSLHLPHTELITLVFHDEGPPGPLGER